MRLLPATAVLAFAGCAGLPAPDTLQIAGESYPVQWTPPPGEARVLLLMEHGWARRCNQLRSTARRLADAGALVLCIDAPMAGGNPALADAFAGWLTGGLRDPQGRAVPARVVVGGHSAGGAFAARVGAKLDALAPERLAGALLLDPVATPAFAADLRRAARGRPVLALMAEAQDCNAQLNALPALREAGAEVVVAGPGSTHLDAEGEDGDAIGRAACGTPQPAQVEALRARAAGWLREVVAQARSR